MILDTSALLAYPQQEQRGQVEALLATASKGKLMNVPRLRFKGFSGEWEEMALEQLAFVERGKFSIRPRNDPKYFGGSIPFVQTGDIVFAGLYLTRFSQTLNEEGLKVSKLFPKGTILITIAANIGDTTITKFDVACTDSVVAVQPYDKKANSVWLKLMLDTKKEELDSKATQNAQKNINLQILRPLLLSTPSFAEQTKIANFLTAVDEKIAQLTQKGELLARYKKGVMQQIFSQQLRFKDDDGRDFPGWENKTIGDVLSIGSGKDYKHLSKGNIPVYGTGGYMLSVDKYLYDGESVCIGRKGTIDKPTLLTGKFWTVDTLFYTHTFINSLPKFIYATFQTINWKNYNEASGVPSLSKSTIEKIDISLPSIIEQTKIANFLTALDDKISQNQAQLDMVKRYKQGLLQQLFV